MDTRTDDADRNGGLKSQRFILCEDQMEGNFMIRYVPRKPTWNKCETIAQEQE